MRLLLIVTVIGFGGPPRHARAEPLPGMWVAMPHHIARTGATGELHLTFNRRRRYEIRAGSACERRMAIIVGPVTRVKLRCALP